MTDQRACLLRAAIGFALVPADEPEVRLAARVAYDSKTGEPEGVLYHVLPALLLNELQGQQRRLEAQAIQLETQATQMETQRAELTALRTRLAILEVAVAGSAGPHRAASTAQALDSGKIER